MAPISVRLYHGGHFVTKKNKQTTYEGGGLSLHLNEHEVCYFEVVGWIKDLGYSEPGTIWYRKHGLSLFNGRRELKCDKDLAEFLISPENDGYFHLYVVHERVRKESVDMGIGRNQLNNGLGDSSSTLGGPLYVNSLGLNTGASSQSTFKPFKPPNPIHSAPKSLSSSSFRSDIGAPLNFLL